eukprot:jgi/Mesvir1/8549/Mv05688-RA.1
MDKGGYASSRTIKPTPVKLLLFAVLCSCLGQLAFSEPYELHKDCQPLHNVAIRARDAVTLPSAYFHECVTCKGLVYNDKDKVHHEFSNKSNRNDVHTAFPPFKCEEGASSSAASPAAKGASSTINKALFLWVPMWPNNYCEIMSRMGMLDFLWKDGVPPDQREIIVIMPDAKKKMPDYFRSLLRPFGTVVEQYVGREYHEAIMCCGMHQGRWQGQLIDSGFVAQILKYYKTDELIATAARARVIANQTAAGTPPGAPVAGSPSLGQAGGLSGPVTTMSPVLAKRRVLFVVRRSPFRVVVTLTELLRKCREEYDCDTIVFEDISFEDMLVAMRTADVLVGVHGAGLVNSFYMRPGSRLVEITPSYFGNKVWWAARYASMYLRTPTHSYRRLDGVETDLESGCMNTRFDEDKRDCNVTVEWADLRKLLLNPRHLG